VVAAAAFGILLLLPVTARVLAHGGLFVIVGAFPLSVLVSVTGGTTDPEGSAIVLVAFLGLAWLAGVGVGMRRSIGRAGRRGHAPPAAGGASSGPHPPS
jgi:hypothetical protein